MLVLLKTPLIIMKHKKGHAIHRIRAASGAKSRGDPGGRPARTRVVRPPQALALAAEAGDTPRPLRLPPAHPPAHPPALSGPAPRGPAHTHPATGGERPPTPLRGRMSNPRSWKLIPELQVEPRKSRRPQAGARRGPGGSQSPRPGRPEAASTRFLAGSRPGGRGNALGPRSLALRSRTTRQATAALSGGGQDGRCGVLVLRKQPQAPK